MIYCLIENQKIDITRLERIQRGDLSEVPEYEDRQITKRPYKVEQLGAEVAFGLSTMLKNPLSKQQAIDTRCAEFGSAYDVNVFI